MSKTSPIAIITDTDRLSAVADAILARCGNPKLTKNTVLNAIASELVGPKTNWGGLKAMSSPVTATSLAGDLRASAMLDLDEEDEEDLPYTLESKGLVLSFPHQLSTLDHKVVIDPDEIPVLQETLFGENGTGEYAGMDATLEVDFHRNITGFAHLYDGTPGEIWIDGKRFADFLLSQRDAILDMICNGGGIGDALHGAFIMVAQDQGEDLLHDIAQEFPVIEARIAEEDADAIGRRIDQACKDAVWLFLAHAAENGERLRVLRLGTHHELVDVIINHEWPLIGDAMRKAFEVEALN